MTAKQNAPHTATSSPQLPGWQLLELAEGQDFEAKRAAGRDGQGQLPESFWETYSAMANTEGGVVLLGIDEPEPGVFSVHGISDPVKVQKELWSGLHNR